jgi:hypothetical protein
MLSVSAILGNLELTDRWTRSLVGAANETARFEQKVVTSNRNLESSFTRLEGSTSGLKSRFNDISTQIRAVEKDFDGVTTVLDRFGGAAKTVGFGMTAAFTVPIVAAGASIIKLGMDAVESENLVSVSFGDMTERAQKWSKGLSDALGLNEFELRKQAGTIFNMSTSMGVAREEAFKMSTGMTKLAADMASFRNIGIEEAFDKLRAGISGEAEPLKRLGIIINETTVKQEAYRVGIAKMGAELTEVQKVQARWSAILRQTANDQGDLARTIDSPSNQLRIMRTRIEEAATSLGASLMPLVGSFVSLISKGVPYIESAAKWFGQLPEPIKLTGVGMVAVVAAGGPLLIMFGSMATAVSSLIAVMGTTGLLGAATTLQGIFFTMGNTVPVLTARLWLMDAALKASTISSAALGGTVGAAFLGVSGTIGAVGAAIAGIAFGIYKVVGAIKDLNSAISSGKVWEFLTARDKDNWLRRGLGLDTDNTGASTRPGAMLEKPKDIHLSSVPAIQAEIASRTAQQEALRKVTQEVNAVAAATWKEIDAAKARGLVGKELEPILAQHKLTEEHLRVRDRLQQQAARSQEIWSKQIAKSAKDETDFTVAVSKGEISLRKQFIAQEEWLKSMRRTSSEFPQLNRGLQTIHTTSEDVARAFNTMGRNAHDALREFILDNRFLEQLEDVEINVLSVNDKIMTWADGLGFAGEQMGGFVGKTVTGLANVIKSWADASKAREMYSKQYLGDGKFGATGGQKIGAAIGGAAGVWGATSDPNPLMAGIGGAMAGMSAVIGVYAAFGSTAGPIGTAVGAIAGFAVGVYRATAALTNYEQAARNAAAEQQRISEEAVAAFGGRERLQGLGRTVGMDIGAAFESSRRGVGREADPKALQEALQEMERRLTRLNSAMEKYKITLGDLGEEARQLRINTTGLELANEFRELTSAGVSAETAIKGMRSGMSDFIVQTIEAGGKIPAALAPVIEQMINMGQLTEQAARALLGLGTDGAINLQQVDEAAKRYGITLDELGPRVNQLRIDEEAQKIVADFKLLTEAGADVGAVTSKMAGSVQGLVTQALKFGLSLPESMKPLVQKMIEAGQLTDQTGGKLTDLSQLTWAESLASKVGDLVAALKDFVEVIKEQAMPSLDKLGRTRIKIPFEFEQQGPDPGEATPRGGIRPREQMPGEEVTVDTREGAAGGNSPFYFSLTSRTYLDGREMAVGIAPRMAEHFEFNGVTTN